MSQSTLSLDPSPWGEEGDIDADIAFLGVDGSDLADAERASPLLRGEGMEERISTGQPSHGDAP